MKIPKVLEGTSVDQYDDEIATAIKDALGLDASFAHPQDKKKFIEKVLEVREVTGPRIDEIIKENSTDTPSTKSKEEKLKQLWKILHELKAPTT